MNPWKAALAVLLFCVAAPHAHAASTYPDRPIRVVVPFGAGSSTDVLARIVGHALEKRLGQPVIVINRPGAYGLIACQDVAKAAPDGYTLGALPDGPMATIPSAYVATGRKPICSSSDVAPISLIAEQPFVIVVRPDVPARTLSEFISYGRKHPDALRFASPHPSGTLGIALLKSIGVVVDRIPFQSEPDAWTQGMLQGNVQGMFSTLYTALQQVRAGNARALAVLASTRSTQLPDVPTASEAGFPELYAFPTWQGIFSPKGLPADRVALLNRTLADVLQDAAVQKRMREITMEPQVSTPEALDARVIKQNAEMTNFIRDKKLTNLVGE